MAEKKLYTEEQAREVVESLLNVARARKNQADVPSDFIEEHPWSLKYLSHFAEANDFMVLAKVAGTVVVEQPLTERLKRWREERKMRPQLNYAVVAPAGSSARLQMQKFTFEQVADGLYICING